MRDHTLSSKRWAVPTGKSSGTYAEKGFGSIPMTRATLLHANASPRVSPRSRAGSASTSAWPRPRGAGAVREAPRAGPDRVGRQARAEPRSPKSSSRSSRTPSSCSTTSPTRRAVAVGPTRLTATTSPRCCAASQTSWSPDARPQGGRHPPGRRRARPRGGRLDRRAGHGRRPPEHGDGRRAPRDPLLRLHREAYPGWRWAITVARVPRGKVATVCETNLVPGEGALLSPEWLPYAERLAPGDLGAGDVLPTRRRTRTSSPGSRRPATRTSTRWPCGSSGSAASACSRRRGEAAAQRWYEGEAALTRRSPRRAPPPARRVASSTRWQVHCALFRRVRQRVVTQRRSRRGLDHGCGAHSEVDVDRHEPVPSAEPLVDEIAYDLV